MTFIMKNIVKIFSGLMLIGALTITTSCGDKFLEEVKRDTISSDYLNTPEGLASMSESLYIQFRQLFYAEGYWPFTNAGTDEFMIGGDGASEAYNTYDSRLSSSPTGSANTAAMSWVWDGMYPWISRANTIIAKAEEVMKGSPLYNETVGTAHFVRGHDYLTLVMQYGEIPLVTEPVDKPNKEYGRDSKEDVYELIISDLKKAYDLLPEKPTVNKLSKYAAAHFLAKAHLWRASEINADWNSKYVAQDLKDCITYADVVIGAHPLAADYGDLFANFTGYDTSITETNSEIVFAASHTHESSIRGTNGGNMTLCWFIAPYQNTFHFLERDIPGGRGYQRMKTTPKYTYFLYDLENDSRFWKSFKTTWAVNKHNKKEYALPDGSKIKDNEYFDDTFAKYMAGMYIINRDDYGQKYDVEDVTIISNGKPSLPNFPIKDYATDKYIPVIRALLAYDNGVATQTSLSPNKDGCYVPLAKYHDGAVHKYNQAQGFRDVVFARSAEAYFFKAEALVRQGNIDQGIAVLKPLRDRAQYKAGEARDEYHDGGEALAWSTYKGTLGKYDGINSFYPRNSYFYSIGGWDKDQAYRDAINAKASTLATVSKSNYPKEDQYIMNMIAKRNPKYASDEFTRALCYILNEKSREMYGEFQRWPDLARTKTLEDRLLTFNDQAMTTTPTDILGNTQAITGYDKEGNAQIITYASPYGGQFKAEKHYLRPIPQNFLDLITKDGKPLTTEEKQAMQNPGY